MKTIKLTLPITPEQQPATPIVLALGFFDGVHRGHQTVIARARQEAKKRGLPLALLTFDQHPAILYGGAKAEQFTYLSLPKRKEALMAHYGVDSYFVIQSNDAFASLTSREFVDTVICGLKAAAVVAGFDYSYGEPDLANMTQLRLDAAGRFDVIEVPADTDNAGKISSTRIRAALDTGDIDLVNELLGYPYETTGVVVHGLARGRELGFRTANVEATPHTYGPGIGIYVVQMTVRGKTYGGMASVGRNITFEPGRPVTVEVHLFDFDADIYDEPVTITWRHYLRGEVKFSGAAALVDQLSEDERASRQYLLTANLNK